VNDWPSHTQYDTYGDSTCGSSVGAFMLDGLMSPLIVFDVSCSQTVPGVPVFDNVLYNYGRAWNSASQSFVAPLAGIYYMSIVIGVAASPASVCADLQVNYGAHYCLVDLSTYHNGIDLVSRGCLLSLNASDTVSIYWHRSGTDSSYGETSLRGFFYSPFNGYQAAWSVHDDGVAGGNGSGSLLFSNILFTEQFIWDPNIGQGTVQQAGQYYMEIVAHTGAASNIYMYIANYGTPASILSCSYLASNVTRSLSVIQHLAASSVTSVDYSNCNLDGSGSGGLSFMGFLLYPDHWRLVQVLLRCLKYFLHILHT
jgi:hypothetical protein